LGPDKRSDGHIVRASRSVTAIVAVLAMPLLAMPAIARLGLAQGGYPNKPIRIIVGFAPGGATDILARLVANHLQITWNAQVVVGAALVAKAPPDGYTLLLGTVGSGVTNQFLYKDMPFDTATAFAPVALVGEVANVLIVHPAVKAKNVQEYVALAKSKPGAMDYGSPAVGGTGHLAMELQGQLSGDPGRAARPRAIGNGQPAGLPAARTGTLRPLGVSSSKRWFSLPDVPTIAEQGVADYDAAPWWYVSAPAGTPADIVTRLSEEIMRGVNSPDMEKRMRDANASTLPGNAEELAKHTAAETIKWKKVVDAAGLKPE
jgi:tripartite-type tricarboxylate transporter receptor subunit TctC